MLILGIKGGVGQHNSSVTLLDSTEQNIIYSSEEERFNNVKYTDAFPIGSITYFLKKFKIKPESIEIVAYGGDRDILVDKTIPYYMELLKQNKNDFSDYSLKPIESSLRVFSLLKKIENRLEQMFPSAKLIKIEHHQTHAASCYYLSGFRKASIVTMDGLGEFASTTFNVGEDSRITRIHQINFPNSLGFVYSLICNYLGFWGPNPEGKIMALASYGIPIYFDMFMEMIRVNDLDFKLNGNYFMFDMYGGVRLSPLFFHKFGTERKSNEELNQKHFDIAASLQHLLEFVVIKLLNKYYQTYPCENLCLSGGVFLNSVLNKKIIDNTKYKNVYITPVANDGGNSLGAALTIKYQQQSIFSPTILTPYLGVEYSQKEIEFHLRNKKLKYTKSTDIFSITANLIANGNIIGWYQGSAEIGPRALCNRSILADPRKKEMKDILNKKVKFREWFRPFAPVVMEDYVQQYFDFSISSPYMLIVCNILKNKLNEIPAVAHVDGTARIQTLNKKQNKKMYRLLEEFYKITQVPLLLNTSFNVAGESIVNNPLDAIECFLFSEMDYLIMENFLISKKENMEHVIKCDSKTFLHRRVNYYKNNFDIKEYRDIFSNDTMWFQ